MARQAALIVLVAWLLSASCSSTTSRPLYDRPVSPPLTFQVTSEPPPDVNGAVVRDAVFRLTFDDYPDPDAAAFGPLLLRSGNATFDVVMKVDLVGRAILVRPRSLLAPNTQYELVVAPTLVALSGRAVPSTMVAPITVGADLAPSPSPSPSPSPGPLTWENDVKKVVSTCAPYCHTIDRCPGRAGKRNPTSRLDLSGDPADPVLGLLNVPSVALTGTENPLLRVQPGDSAHSVLLRKLLGGDPHADSADPPTANLKIPGRRMPLYESVCGEDILPPEDFYFDETKLRLVQDWIDQGAIK